MKWRRWIRGGAKKKGKIGRWLNRCCRKIKLDPDLEIGDVGEVLDNSAAWHKLSVRPRRKHADPRARNVSRSPSDTNFQR